MYRIEFQQRGSPHAHMAFWIEGAPHFETSSDKELQNFPDKYVSCSLPSDDEELCSLVKKLQTHVHSFACMKSGKECRFSFPKPPSDSAMIVHPDNEEIAQNNLTKTQVLQILQLVYDKLDELEDDVTIEQLQEQNGISPQLYYSALSKSKNSDGIIMKRKPSEKCVNNYNPTLLKLWKANMDIQLVSNPYSCVIFIYT